MVGREGGWGLVGQDHMHYKALTKIFLLNIVLLSVDSSKSLNNDCNMTTDGHCC